MEPRTLRVDPETRTRDAAAVDPIWRLALKRASAIVTLNKGRSGCSIFIVHPVSGDVVGLRGLAELLSEHPVYGIQVPRDRMIAPLAASIEDMARHYVDLVSLARPQGQIILAGWSIGAILALEMARQFRVLGRDIPLLVALDGAPCNTGAGLRPWQPTYLMRLIVNLPRWIRDDVEQDWSPSGVWKRLNFKLAARFGIASLGKAPEGLRNVQTLDADIVQGLLDARGWSADQTAFIHAMYKATLDYVPETYDGRVIVYETKTQPLYHLRQVGAAWRKIAACLEIVRLDGNHSGIIQEPSIGIIARHLLATLSDLGHNDPGAAR